MQKAGHDLTKMYRVLEKDHRMTVYAHQYNNTAVVF